MEAIYAAGVAVAALIVAAGVSFFTKTILDRQTELAKQMNELAGGLQIRRVSDAGPYDSFREVLTTRPPNRRLDIWAVSGWTLLQPHIVQLLLQRGVEIRALLLDPHSKAASFIGQPWLVGETTDTLRIRHKINVPDTESDDCMLSPGWWMRGRSGGDSSSSRSISTSACDDCLPGPRLKQ